MINDKASDVTEWPGWLTPYDADPALNAMRARLLRLWVHGLLGEQPPPLSENPGLKFKGRRGYTGKEV